MSLPDQRNDGVYAFRASHLSELLSGAFFPYNATSVATENGWGYSRFAHSTHSRGPPGRQKSASPG
eukprot:5207780-Prymnesium_polylepis.1